MGKRIAAIILHRHNYDVIMAENTEPVKSNAPALHKRKYVGPDYENGLVVPGYHKVIKPKDMNDAQVKELVERYPPAIEWWEKA